jgi:uncharacterized protein GlcG (DUF336 family)
MSEVNKIKDEELQVIRQAVSNVNRAKTTLGDMVFQQAQLIKQTEELEAKLREEQVKLEEAYGAITVNLETGEYEEAAQEVEEAVMQKA